MYNLPRDLALKKKKQALRRLSQSGTQGATKPLISPIYAGKRLPGPPRGAAYGGKFNANVKAKNPFQLATATPSDAPQQESGNPFSSVTQASKPSPFLIQSGPLFKSSGNEFSNNPFIASSASSSFSTSGTSGGRLYAQAVKTGGRTLLEYPPPTSTTTKPNPYSYDSSIQAKPVEQHVSPQNPFAKPSGFKLSNPKHVGVQDRIHGGVSKLHKSAPPTTHQYMVTLSVRNIDQNMCTPDILRSHFQQFGDVCDLKCMPRKGMATVSYSDHKAALRAKQQGTILDQSYPPLHIVLQKKRPASSSQPGEGDKKRGKPSDYIWVNPSIRLAAMDDGTKGEAATSDRGLQTEQPPSLKSSIFNRLGSPVGKEQQGSSLKLPPEAKQKYSPRFQNEDEEYVPSKEDWEQRDYDIDEDSEQNVVHSRVTNVDNADNTMDTIARHVGHSYDLRSLHRGTGGGDINAKTGVAPVSLVANVSSAVVDIPKPVLPAGPVSSLTAARAYEILEERDTQIRKTMVKQTSLATAQAIVGTCPDMCPEKERYRRESTKRLSIFEVLPISDPQNPQVDHTKAVKEYSGSAADKDEPLPHELRPPHVLAMTMDYLVTMVINNHSAERSGEWFNFIWNRTRAVRKDITLQHLCSPAVVDIVEKCARFHVLCGHLMCEEDVSSFDAKMNSDNLAKCLQTLKEFYRDLRKRGIECRNEPEFCCYDILLHLNEGDVLCKIDDYTPGIYRSPLVHFAIQMASAWSSNNFVRFFKLVRLTTYLNTCLLHRYFNQVRSMALGLLLRTHTAVKQSSYFAVTDMQNKMLCMESQEQVIAFCGHHGIEVEENGSRFVLSRDTYLEPEKPYENFRSRELVESKNDKTFGEVVQGSPLPPVPHHIPESSLGNKTSSHQLPTTVVARDIYDEKDILVIVEDVVCDVMQSEITSLVAVATSEVQQLYFACDQVGVGLIDDVIVSSCMEISQKAYAEESERIREQKEEREKLLNKIASSFVIYLMEQTTSSEIHIIAENSLREEHLIAEIHRNAMDHVMLQIASSVVAIEIQNIVKECITEAIVQRKQRLSFIASSVMTIRTAKYFSYWRRATLRCQQVKQCLEAFPPSVPLRPLSWLLEQLQPSEKKPRLDFPADPSTLLQNRTSALTSVIDKFNKSEEDRKQFWSPLSIPDLVSGQLMARLQSPPLMEPANSWAHHHWQLLLVLPPVASGIDSTSVHWLKTVLSVAPPLLPTCTGAVELLSFSDEQKIKVIVKSSHGCVPSGEQEVSLKGTSAILMYYVGIIQVNKLVEQLNSFIINIKLHPRLPLVVLCDDEVSLAATETSIIEEALCAAFPVLSAVNFIPYSLSAILSQPQQFCHQRREELCEAVKWLALNSSLPPVLTWQPLYDYMEQGLLELFVQPLMTDHKLRLTLGVTPQPCRGVVAFYNAAVEHLALLAASEGLVQFSWPSKEISSSHFSFKGAPPIYWNETSHLANLNQMITGLKITMVNIHKEDELSFENCMNFVRSVCEAHHVLDPLPLITNVHKMLQQQTDRCVSWAHVVTMCMSHLLKSVGPDQWVCHCHEKKQPTFKEPPEWLTCVASTTLARVQQCNTPKTDHRRAKSHRRHWTDPLDTAIIVSSNYCSPNIKNSESMKKKLFSTLEQERQLTKEFDDLLMQYTTTHQ